MYDPITTYGIAFSIANFLGASSLLVLLKKKNLDINIYLNLILLAFITAPIGARALYVLLYWNDYRHLSWLARVNVFDGGLSFYGGFALFFPLFFFYTRSKQQSVIHIANHLAPSLALSLAIVRIGCLSAGCCGGRYIDSLRIIYPAQLIESTFLFLLSVFLFHSVLKDNASGKKASIIFIMTYSAFRFLTDYFREDHSEYLITPMISLSQILSLMALLPAIYLLFKNFDNYKKIHD